MGAGFVFAEQGAEPLIGILKEDFQREISYADSVELRDFLRERKLGARFLTADELADPSRLTSKQIDIVLLPYGSCFPIQARENWIAYLKNGGAFVSLGGYAFDDLMKREGENWKRIETDDPTLYLSGRRGKPADWIQLQLEQIAIFDPTYSFKRVAYMGNDSDSPLMDPDWSKPISLSGFPATALTGNNNPVFPKPHARWYSLVMSYDRYKRKHGSVFSLMIHHDGPYRGSAWAFSGVTSENLFSKRHPEMLNALYEAIDMMRIRTALVRVEAVFDSSNGKAAVLSTFVNFGKKQRTVQLKTSIHSTLLPEETISIAPGEIRKVRQAIPASLLCDGFNPITVTAKIGEHFKDCLKTGLIRNPLDRVCKTKYTYEDNYFRVNGQPQILFGSNQTGMIWYSPRENPFVWERDLIRMRDNGLRVLRVLHFSPFAGRGYEGLGRHTSMDLNKKPPEKLIQQTDDFVSMCARHGVALILSLHDWLPVELSDEELDAQRKWARFWSDRYKNHSHVSFDIQNEPFMLKTDTPLRRELWNRFLQKKYGTDAELRKAWGEFASSEPLGEIPCQAGSDQWNDPRPMDYNRFQAWLLKRWIDVNRQGIQEGSPDALVTVGFLQRSFEADKWLAEDTLDYANVHYHGPLEEFPCVLKEIDHRFRNQGLSVGEFGAWDAHEMRTHGQFIDPTSSAVQHILAVGHETLGMGGCFALNWDLKDFDDCIFPWGLSNAQDYVQKDWLSAYRNMSLFFSSIQPRYEDTGVYLLIPDHHRLGAKSGLILRAIRNSIQMLFAAHLNFNVINEMNLHELPSEAHTILWPIPYCPSDEVFDRVLSFVRDGGTLYFSGDVSFDSFRRPKRGERMEWLGLSPIESTYPFDKPIPSEIPAFQTSQIENGCVFFTPYPIELKAAHEWIENPYIRFLEQIQAPSISVSPNDPNLHLFSIPQRDTDALVYTLFRLEKDSHTRNYRVRTIGGDVELSLEGLQTGLIEIDPAGSLSAIEGTSVLRCGEFTARTTGHLMLRALDRRGLHESRAIAVFPTTPGVLEIQWKNQAVPKILVGEPVNGEWKQYETLSSEMEEESVYISIDPDRAISILLLTDAEHETNAVARLMASRNE